MKMKLYYAVAKVDDEVCDMLAGPMTYEEAYDFIKGYNDPRYFFVVHRFIEVQ